jgi:antitoxin (DNA-binding transcriptional repressor) of toxin-antitoxin stability system
VRRVRRGEEIGLCRHPQPPDTVNYLVRRTRKHFLFRHAQLAELGRSSPTAIAEPLPLWQRV